MPNLLVLGIVVPLFLLAVLLAALSYGDGGSQRDRYKKYTFRVMPYAVVILAALYFAGENEDLAIVGLELAFYVALTWIVVWAVRKQWDAK